MTDTKDHVCEQCRGTGFEITEHEGHEYARPCACRTRSAGSSSYDPLAASRIPPRYRHCTFSEFAPVSTSHTAALEAAMRYCNGFPFQGIDDGLGLLLVGGSGVGKTHLAVAVLQELVSRKNVRGQFWDFQELMREIRSSYDPETKTSEIQVLQPVIETDVLLLDDLGAWRITDWMNDTLFQILNSRYLGKRATLITTNFQDVTAEEARTADATTRREFLVDRIGNRLRSRLSEMCLLVKLAGNDFRHDKQQSHRYAVLGTSTGEAPEAPRARPAPPRPRFGG